MSNHSESMEQATFGSGCFWCTEAVFKELRGIASVVSGYSGGHVADPTYEQVCGGQTGHAEVVQITFDPNQITYPELLEIFWKTHDPTTLNRQGHDVGTQYRSAVFYHNQGQRQAAEEMKGKLDRSGAFGSPIATEISPLTRFYPAEDYHQNYFEQHPGQGYCAAVIRPKVDKFRAAFGEKLSRRPA
ncbi:MAG: peptide-methionine (S)-S-oxide reductase MsrA [Pirellulales bacterium]